MNNEEFKIMRRIIARLGDTISQDKQNITTLTEAMTWMVETCDYIVNDNYMENQQDTDVPFNLIAQRGRAALAKLNTEDF